MAKRSTPSDKVILDSVFSIPEGAEDQFVHSDDEVDIDTGTEEDVFSYLDSLDLEVEDEIEYETGYDDEDYDEELLETPEDFVIISQTLRRGPGGQQVVDIVIEAEDVDGATHYEIQVTKI